MLNPIAVSYDAFDSVAAFAAAIAIAYGSLPNFRHRERIREYVRTAVADNSIVKVLKSNEALIAHECWCILHRLGNLQAAGHPAPRHESDENFQQRQDFKSFNWLYVSNLDKLIAIALGSIAATVVWFGLLDRMYFPDPHQGNQLRIWFLGTATAFYLLVGLLAFISITLHRILAPSALDHAGLKYNALLIVNWVTVIVFLILFGLTDLGVHFFGSWGLLILGWLRYAPFNLTPEDAAFVITRNILLLTILSPLYLLWRGDGLTHKMKTEADRCVRVLGSEAIGQAEGSSIDPEANPPT